MVNVRQIGVGWGGGCDKTVILADLPRATRNGGLAKVLMQEHVATGGLVDHLDLSPTAIVAKHKFDIIGSSQNPEQKS
eukprot:SAG11_NODE_8468_length_1012_cov_0.599124_2_plen_78_part_00